MIRPIKWKYLVHYKTENLCLDKGDTLGIVNKYFKEDILTDKTAIQDLATFFGTYLNIPKDLTEFDNLGEAYDLYRNVDFETIKSKIESRTSDLKKNKATIQGEIVKSLEEVMIANFLYLNGVKYTYERAYPFESGDPFRKQYRPDFYLDDYDIYLEHFGITEDSKVPWLSEIEGKKYLEGIKWKRQIHNKNGTILIETYSYFNKNGTLHIELDKLLHAHGVVYNKVDYEELYNKLFMDQGDKYFYEFKKLIQTFIGLFKSRGYTKEEFNSLNQAASKIDNIFLRDRTKLFL